MEKPNCERPIEASQTNFHEAQYYSMKRVLGQRRGPGDREARPSRKARYL